MKVMAGPLQLILNRRRTLVYGPYPALLRANRPIAKDGGNILKSFVCLACTLIAAGSFPAWARAEKPATGSRSQFVRDSDLATAIGAPLAPRNTASEIQNAIFSNWKALAKRQGHERLLSIKGPSAVVACIDWSKTHQTPIGFEVNFEWWWEEDSVPASTPAQVALSECTKWRSENKSSCDCAEIAEDMKPTAKISPEVERDYRENTSGYYSPERFLIAKKTVLLDSAAGSKPRAEHPEYSRGVTPSTPAPMDYPYAGIDYDEACWGLYTYLLAKAMPGQESRIRERLASLENEGAYGCLKSGIDLIPGEIDDPAQTPEEHCKVAVKVTGARLLEAFKFPKTIGDALKRENVKSIWIEVAERVAKDGRPILIMDGVKPLAVETDRGIFLGAEVKWPTPEWACAVTTAFPGQEILKISNCKGNSCTFWQRKMLDGVIITLKNKPFEADEPVLTGVPGEYSLSRESKQSDVLGSPYYECSEYLMEVWTSGGRQILLDFFPSGRGTGNGSSLFLNLTQVLTTSANKLAKCEEPDSWQINKYKSELIKSLTNSIAMTCKTFGGAVQSGTCILNIGAKP
jgi:hypothetical protein